MNAEPVRTAGGNLFETVKNSVTAREAAERYGLQVSKHGMCKCPFHSDRNPSMKVDKRFHCFGCQADGDVINFTARLFKLTQREAALKLAKDFAVEYDRSLPTPSKRKHADIPEKEIFEHKAAYVYGELAEYRNRMVRWMHDYAPGSPEDSIHPFFMEAIRNLAPTEEKLDTLLSDDEPEKRQIVSDYLHEKHKHKEEPAMDPVVNVPVYHHSAAHARKFDELEQYRKSHFANIDCKNEIEHAISANFDGYRLNRHALDEVMERYGPERVSLVLAATVQVKAWDGRFSNANKDWAFTFDFPEPVNDLGFDRRDNYAVATHPAVLDGFINLVRQEIKARENTKEAVEAGTPAMPEHKPAKHKTHSMER